MPVAIHAKLRVRDGSYTCIDLVYMSLRRLREDENYGFPTLINMARDFSVIQPYDRIDQVTYEIISDRIFVVY
jgi:hypothetical protein